MTNKPLDIAGFLKLVMDMGLKFYITGSNASLLSRELGTRLTGRYVPIELFPFSFKEYLEFRGEETPDVNRMTTVQRARLQSLLQAYLESGGIPDALKYPELPVLRTVYDDVLYCDIATRYRLDDVTAIREPAFYLISNPTSLISFNKPKDPFRPGSVNTIKNYIKQVGLLRYIHESTRANHLTRGMKMAAPFADLAEALLHRLKLMHSTR